MNSLDKKKKHMCAGKVYMSLQSAPPGVTYHRDNTDVMNNFFIQIVSKSFTTIEDQTMAILENKEQIRQRAQLTEFERISEGWRNGLVGNIDDQLD